MTKLGMMVASSVAFPVIGVRAPLNPFEHAAEMAQESGLLWSHDTMSFSCHQNLWTPECLQNPNPVSECILHQQCKHEVELTITSCIQGCRVVAKNCSDSLSGGKCTFLHVQLTPAPAPGTAERHQREWFSAIAASCFENNCTFSVDLEMGLCSFVRRKLFILKTFMSKH